MDDLLTYYEIWQMNKYGDVLPLIESDYYEDENTTSTKFFNNEPFDWLAGRHFA